MDKRVLTCSGDFRGIKSGDLIKLRSGISMHDFKPDDVALVIDRVTNALMLGDGDGEYYDLILIVVNRGRRYHICIDDVEKVRENE